MTERNTADAKAIAAGSAVRSPWVWFMGAIIASVVGANLVMLFFAVNTNPGLVARDYYERGKSFTSRTRAEFVKRRELGLKLELAGPEKVYQGSPALFRLRVANGGKGLVQADTATLYVYRPSDGRADFSVPMTRASDGAYEASVSFPLKGAWDIIAEAGKDGGRDNRARRVNALGRPR